MILTQNYLVHIYCEVSYFASTVLVILYKTKYFVVLTSKNLFTYFCGKTKYVEEIPSSNQILFVQIFVRFEMINWFPSYFLKDSALIMLSM